MDENNKWVWVNIRVLRDGPEMGAIEYIKDTRHSRTTTDAVCAAIMEFAMSLGWDGCFRQPTAAAQDLAGL